MKKFLSLLLTMMMFFISASVFSANEPQKDYPQKFWDVPKNHWAFPYIAELVNKGVLTGYEDGSFRPDRTVSRAEWAKIMVLAAGLPTTDNNVYFADMQNHWANIYVNTAKNYLAAYTDGTFKPNQAAAREDVTVSMVKLKGYDINDVDYSYLSRFSDQNSISNSLKVYVAVAVQKELISGFNDGTFRGQNTLTRAEAATLLWRAFQYGNDNKVVDVPTTPVAKAEESTNEDEKNIVASSKPIQQTEPKDTQATKESEQVIEKEKEKPYVIDTLKQVNLDSDFTYDGEKIYYISNSNIYSLDPFTGKTKVVYNTDDLVLQKTEMKEKEITKTITVSVEETEEDTIDEEAESAASSNAESDDDTESETENSESLEISEEDEDKPKTITKEITEIISEEVVVEEYSNYVPTQIKYDEYNDRLIMTGYYKNHEKAFEAPDDNAEYYVAYDITNDELFWEFNLWSSDVMFECFLSNDKAILYDTNWVSYEPLYNTFIVDTQTKSGTNQIQEMWRYWPLKNDLYGFSGEGIYKGAYLYKYDFSDGGFDSLFRFSENYCVGINEDNVYYLIDNAMNKLNLSSGKTNELSITTNGKYCDVLDMTPFSAYNLWREFIPVSDTHFVFYDEAAKAFRTLSKK